MVTCLSTIGGPFTSKNKTKQLVVELVDVKFAVKSLNERYRMLTHSLELVLYGKRELR